MVSMAIASIWASITAWFTPTLLFCAANLIIATIFIASNNTNNNHGDSPTRISRVSSFLDRARSMKLSSYSTITAESESKTATYSSSSRLAQSIHLSSDYVAPPELYHHHSDELYPSVSDTQPVNSPSLFERVKSIKFSSVPESDSPTQLVRSPSFLDRVRSFRISPNFESKPNSTQSETTVDTDPNPKHNPEHHVIRSKSDKTPAKKPLTEMKKSRSEMRISPSEDEDVDLRRPATARETQNNHDVDEEVDSKADDFISRFKQQLKLQRIESLKRYNRMLNRSS